MAATATPPEVGGDEERGGAASDERPLTLKERIYLITDDPGSSTAATVLGCFILACIAGSTVCFCLETVPALQKYTHFWYWSEVFFVTVFTIEYCVRFMVTPLTTQKFVLDPFNLIDLLAVLPFFIELMTSDSSLDLRVLRAVRLVRIFRVFKVGKYSTNAQLLGRAMAMSTEALVLLAFFLTMAMVLFGTIMYSFEQGAWNDEKGCHVRAGEDVCSPFESIPHSFYWAITTMTTVGYGDVLPTTGIGKVVSGVCMVCGILVIALPITMIGNTFVEAHNEIQSEKKLKEVQELMKEDSESQRELYALTQDTEAIQGETNEILRRIKRLLAAAMVVNQDTEPGEALGSLNSCYEVLQSAAVESIDDLNVFVKTALPSHYS